MAEVLRVSIAPDADPADPLTWVFEDITGFMRLAEGISVNYGQRDEGSEVDTTNVTLRLTNADGRFTRLNPLSPYFGRIRSGTPIRIEISGGGSRLWLPGDGARCGAGHDLSHDLAGDLDLRTDYIPAVPEPVLASVPNLGVAQSLAMRYHPSTNTDRAWQLIHHKQLDTTFDGEGIRFVWYPTGQLASQQIADSGPFAPAGWNGRRAVRVTLELDVAGDHRISWYQAPTLAGPWELFAQETRSGTTAIGQSDEPLMIGAAGNGFPSGADISLRGGVYGMELLDGVDGTVVASPDFTTAPLGTGGFSDPQGNAWALAGGGSVSDGYDLFTGFVEEWPGRWDKSGKNSSVPIRCSGQLRRLNQHKRETLRSALYRAILDTVT